MKSARINEMIELVALLRYVRQRRTDLTHPVKIRKKGLMASEREADEFERMRLIDQIERDRALIAQYDEHQAFYRTRVENNRYKLGRLDERLGG